MSEAVDPKTGLTPAEGEVLQMACKLWGAWLALPVQHPDDSREVCDAVHVVQNLLAVRIARRHYPGGWPDRGAEEAKA